MKMDVMTDLNGTSVSSDGVLPCATEIGREFIRQYYTLLSERPSDVHKFYSHESIFIHGDVQAVGQQKIAKAIDSLDFEECKVRIHTIKGSHTVGQGLVLQICGEMQENDRTEPRFFFQTIVLCQQNPKKFYVHNNLFQFADASFSTIESEKPAVHADRKAVVHKVNGHGSTLVTEKTIRAKPDIQSSARKEKEIIKSPGVEKSEEENRDPTPVKQLPPSPAVAPSPSPATTVIPATTPVASTTPAAAPAPAAAVQKPVEVTPVRAAAVAAPVSHTSAPPPPAPVKEEPKTWAKLVGGSGSKATANTIAAPAKPPAAAAAVPAAQQQQPNALSARGTEDKRDSRLNGQREERKRPDGDDRREEQRGSKLYIGGITRNKIPTPADEDRVVAEIINVFSAYGEVDSVFVPRKCYEPPVNSTRAGTAFAFVSMASAADAQRVFQACRKDDSNAQALRASVPSFGFDGEVSVSLSDPKPTGPRPGGYRGGSRGGAGGATGGGGRGGFVHRGAPRGGGRGAFNHHHN